MLESGWEAGSALRAIAYHPDLTIGDRCFWIDGLYETYAQRTILAVHFSFPGGGTTFF
jgi:hypothetical protein